MGRPAAPVRLLALATVLVLLAVGCAPEEPDDEPDAEEPEVPDPEEAEEPAAPEEPEAEPVEGLRLGYLLPETGPLSFAGPGMIHAVELAVAEINEAGGVLGVDVELFGADEAGDAGVASASVDSLLESEVHAVVGAAASGISLAVIDRVVGAGVVQCSPSNTSPTFTDYDDDGWYFRTAPTDVLQGPVLAELIVGDGHASVAIAARGDDYGQALAETAGAALEEAGATVVETVIYDPEASTFDAEVQQLTDADPQAVLLIAFDEATQILQTMIEQALGPEDVALYGADGVRNPNVPAEVDPADPSVLDGFKGTAPDPAADPTFVDRLLEFAPQLDNTVFAAQAFDCAVIIGLAAESAGSLEREAIRDAMVDVTRAGEACSSFADCAALLADGQDIDYNGAAGAVDFTDTGEPDRGNYEIWAFDADGAIETLEVVESTAS